MDAINETVQEIPAPKRTDRRPEMQRPIVSSEATFRSSASGERGPPAFPR